MFESVWLNLIIIVIRSVGLNSAASKNKPPATVPIDDFKCAKLAPHQELKNQQTLLLIPGVDKLEVKQA